MDPKELERIAASKSIVFQTSTPDPVNPAHYKFSGIEPIQAIEAWNLGFCLGNTVKYISRAGRKGDALEDLRKARWYLDREIARREGGGQ